MVFINWFVKYQTISFCIWIMNCMFWIEPMYPYKYFLKEITLWTKSNFLEINGHYDYFSIKFLLILVKPYNSRLFGGGGLTGGGGEWGLPPSPIAEIGHLPPPPAPPPDRVGRQILPAPVKSLCFFHLENEVYLGKIAFASENLEKFSPPAGYFSVQHLWFCTISIGKLRWICSAEGAAKIGWNCPFLKICS